MMSKVLTYVPIENLGVVRSHAALEVIAHAMTDLGATSFDRAIMASAISAELEQRGAHVERKTLYNRLKRPGFVRVDNGNRQITMYYYQFDEGFGKLAQRQGSNYYPKNLGPLAAEPIIESVEGNAPSSKAEVIGSQPNSADDLKAVPVRAMRVTDNMIQDISPEQLTQLAEMFASPHKHRKRLENYLVTLASLYRWVEIYETYDDEKKAWFASIHNQQ